MALGRRRELLSSGESALLLGVPGGSFTMGSKEYQDESSPPRGIPGRVFPALRLTVGLEVEPRAF